MEIAFSELRTPRLVLRRLRHDDIPALCAYRSQPEVARYQDWESFGPDDAARLIDSQSGLEANVPGTWFQLAVVVTATGVIVGDCGLHCLEDPRQMEIGITLAPSHQGRGYATEVIECLLDFVFGSLGKHRVTAVTDAENHSAAKLFERLGSAWRPTSSRICGSRAGGEANSCLPCCDASGNYVETSASVDLPVY